MFPLCFHCVSTVFPLFFHCVSTVFHCVSLYFWNTVFCTNSKCKKNAKCQNRIYPSRGVNSILSFDPPFCVFDQLPEKTALFSWWHLFRLVETREDHFQKICPKRTFPPDFVKLVSEVLYLFLADKRSSVSLFCNFVATFTILAYFFFN